VSTRPRFAVFASGGGRSLENLCEEVEAGHLAAEIGLVVVDKPSAGALERAARWNLSTATLPKEPGESVADYSERLFTAVEAAGGIELVVLAGFLKLLEIPAAWHGRVINIHPSLLPAFGGKGYFGDHVHRAVLERGVEVTGCTVHYVDDEYDHGRVLLQRWIPVPAGIDAHGLAAVVFEEEKRALPAAITRHFSRKSAPR
jgi:phosphoribosylglycinamide formyltransferase-1